MVLFYQWWFGTCRGHRRRVRKRGRRRELARVGSRARRDRAGGTESNRQRERSTFRYSRAGGRAIARWILGRLRRRRFWALGWAPPADRPSPFSPIEGEGVLCLARKLVCLCEKIVSGWVTGQRESEREGRERELFAPYAFEVEWGPK